MFKGALVFLAAFGLLTLTFYNNTETRPQKSMVIVFSLDYVIDPTKGPNSEFDLARRLEPPFSYDNLLSYSFRMSEMSKELSDIFRDLLKKDIRLSSNESSYVGKTCMVIITDDVIHIQVYNDMASLLTRDEILAYAIHEIAHIYLRHKPILGERPIMDEIAADIWTVNKGIDPRNIISGMVKLKKSDEKERNDRIYILNAYLAN